MNLRSVLRETKPTVAALLALPIPVIAALISLHCHGATLPRDFSSDALSARPAVSQSVTLSIAPAALISGKSSKAVVQLKQPAPAGGAVVNLSASDPGLASVPNRVMVPAGKSMARFDVVTNSVTSLRTVNISASYQANTTSNTLTILPKEKRQWYASTTGMKSGLGTTESPWDLTTALAQAAIRPGDTLWLMGGVYVGTFVSSLAGSAEAPIIVRAVPGQRVVIDKAAVNDQKQPALKVKGAWVWFWDLEITNSNTNRQRHSPYSGNDEPWRGSGVDVYASHVKFINMIFHDNGHGIWDKQDMTEIHSCLFFYNGNNKREHAMYVGNSSGTKFITDNVVFNQGGYGILAHSDSTKSSQTGLHVEGNIAFNNGSITGDDQKTGNLQVGGVQGVSAQRVVVKDNFVYVDGDSASSKNNGLRLGYEDTGNKDVKILDNYIVAENPLILRWWRDVEFRGNTILSQGEATELTLPSGVSTSTYQWDFNSYLTRDSVQPVFRDGSGKLSFSSWRQATGLDRNSDVRPAAGVQVFVRPNRYEPGRANIVVFNWDRQQRVSVDLSTILDPGVSFEIRDVQNYFGEAVMRGEYNGGFVQLPMTSTRVTPPVGNVERMPRHTSVEFGTFIVRVLSSSKSTSKGQSRTQ